MKSIVTLSLMILCLIACSKPEGNPSSETPAGKPPALEAVVPTVQEIAPIVIQAEQCLITDKLNAELPEKAAEITNPADLLVADSVQKYVLVNSIHNVISTIDGHTKSFTVENNNLEILDAQEVAALPTPEQPANSEVVPPVADTPVDPAPAPAPAPTPETPAVEPPPAEAPAVAASSEEEVKEAVEEVVNAVVTPEAPVEVPVIVKGPKLTCASRSADLALDDKLLEYTSKDVFTSFLVKDGTISKAVSFSFVLTLENELAKLSLTPSVTPAALTINQVLESMNNAESIAADAAEGVVRTAKYIKLADGTLEVRLTAKKAQLESNTILQYQVK